jgi:type II secretory pathway predicted ATPase ExeA
VIEKLQGFYGFTRMPFGRDLAPGMLHRHHAHGEAVARITWCITERRIGVITGEVGAGKTVAIRAALAAHDPTRHIIIYLPNPTIGVRGIHHQIVTALGGQPLVHHATLVPQATEALATEQAERGRTPVLVIDEAHLLDHPQLESIRMPTNHDMDLLTELREICSQVRGHLRARGTTVSAHDRTGRISSGSGRGRGVVSRGVAADGRSVAAVPAA